MKEWVVLQDAKDEGREEGRDLERENSIQTLINVYREEMKLNDDEIVERIMRRYSLTKEMAEDKVFVK
jgi:hypothetical protein